MKNSWMCLASGGEQHQQGGLQVKLISRIKSYKERERTQPNRSSLSFLLEECLIRILQDVRALLRDLSSTKPGRGQNFYPWVKFSPLILTLQKAKEKFPDRKTPLK